MSTSFIQYLSSLREMNAEVAKILDVYREIETVYRESLRASIGQPAYSLARNMSSVVVSSNVIFSAQSNYMPASAVSNYVL